MGLYKGVYLQALSALLARNTLTSKQAAEEADMVARDVCDRYGEAFERQVVAVIPFDHEPGWTAYFVDKDDPDGDLLEVSLAGGVQKFYSDGTHEIFYLSEDGWQRSLQQDPTFVYLSNDDWEVPDNLDELIDGALGCFRNQAEQGEPAARTVNGMGEVIGRLRRQP